MSLKKFFSIVMIMLALVTSGGCSTSSQSDNASESNEVTQEQTQNDTKNDAEEELIEDDTKINEAILNEEGVNFSNVVLMDGSDTKYVLVDIKLEDGAEVDAEALAKKYGEQLKEKYSDRTVDVKVMQHDEEIYNASF